ncbi:MAG: hypothetical protein DI604_15245 [Delftia acidovorans]|nr:MAG: hypothetical protein DI604_15245 [Delftia acidovorans]
MIFPISPIRTNPVFKKSIKASAVALLAMGAAIWLRSPWGKPLRHLVGPDLTAAVEHLLAGFSYTLLAASAFYLGTMILLGLVLRLGLALDPDPEAHLPFSSIVTLACVIGFGYLVYQGIWETRQAFVSVYGGPARGYVQHDQLFCDFAGVGLAIAWVQAIARGGSVRRQGD